MPSLPDAGDAGDVERLMYGTPVAPLQAATADPAPPVRWWRQRRGRRWRS
jgi:hypothetical protein